MKTWIYIATLITGLLTLGTVAAYYLGLRVNLTESMPRGLWLARPYDAAHPIMRNDVVEVCLEYAEAYRDYLTPGNCPNGLQPLLKSIGAIPGDTVEMTVDGATVNGIPLRNTAPLPKDRRGRSLPHLVFDTYTVPPGQVFLFSSYSTYSLDSRYFGPISVDTIIARDIPLLAW